MQYLITLSITEVEYITLPTALCEVIVILNLLEELKENSFNVHSSALKVTCCTFEDNKSCIYIETNHRNRPITKYFSALLHHILSHVVRKTITTKQMSTEDKIEEIFRKSLRGSQFYKIVILLMSWAKGKERYKHVL